MFWTDESSSLTYFERVPVARMLRVNTDKLQGSIWEVLLIIQVTEDGDATGRGSASGNRASRISHWIGWGVCEKEELRMTFKLAHNIIPGNRWTMELEIKKYQGIKCIVGIGG